MEHANIYNYRSNDINEIAEALSNAQGVMGAVKKDKQGYGYKYAELSSIIELVRKPFLENGLCFSHHTLGGTLKCVLMHKSGQWLSSDYEIRAEQSKNINYNQAIGSAITYGRRYTLSSLIGIPQEDDDGVGSMSKESKPPPPPKPIVTEEETLRREMNGIYKDFKENLEIAVNMEQKVAYAWDGDVIRLFNYADSKPKLKVMLDELLEHHEIVLKEQPEYEHQ